MLNPWKNKICIKQWFVQIKCENSIEPFGLETFQEYFNIWNQMKLIHIFLVSLS